MDNVILQTDTLSKHYGNTTALCDFSAAFAPGKIYGLLGRNGAGKTASAV